MPEGPEVRITVEQLNKLVIKQKLVAININSGRYSKKVPSGYHNFIEQLPLKLEKICCKGKFIWFEFEKGHYMFNTSVLRFSREHKKLRPHIHSTSAIHTRASTCRGSHYSLRFRKTPLCFLVSM